MQITLYLKEDSGLFTYFHNLYWHTIGNINKCRICTSMQCWVNWWRCSHRPSQPKRIKLIIYSKIRAVARNSFLRVQGRWTKCLQDHLRSTRLSRSMCFSAFTFLEYRFTDYLLSVESQECRSDGWVVEKTK